MPVDDNGFMLLQTADRQVAFLHASCTEWKNTFLVGDSTAGRASSGGRPRRQLRRRDDCPGTGMLPEMGPPETTIWEYPMPDNSWDVEMAEFHRRYAQRPQHRTRGSATRLPR